MVMSVLHEGADSTAFGRHRVSLADEACGTMTHVDAVILNATEWCCRRLQLLTGRTNVWLAAQLTNVSIIVYFVWAGMYFWNADLALRVWVGVFCCGLLYALSQTIL